MVQLEQAGGICQGSNVNVTGYVYVVARDYGFAPNPFYGLCTLATCKPDIRQGAQIGDWIIGVSSKARGHVSKLVYIMEINQKISLDQYWNDPIFLIKRPVMNGSLKQHYGDNIYHYSVAQKRWIQIDSHHSNEDGSTNFYNLNRDTKRNYVLISTHFYYFGRNMVRIPVKFQTEIKSVRGYRKIINKKFLKVFLSWISGKYNQGYNGVPLLFENIFERYDGVS